MKKTDTKKKKRRREDARYAHGSRLSLPRRDETKKFLARFLLRLSFTRKFFCREQKIEDKVTPYAYPLVFPEFFVNVEEEKNPSQTDFLKDFKG